MNDEQFARLKEEYLQLKEKMERLGEFLYTDVFNELDVDERNELDEQFYTMKNYLNLLVSRIGRETMRRESL